MELTVAIPTFNNHQQLLWCLASLTNYTEYPTTVIVVNNGDPMVGDMPFEDWLRRCIPFRGLRVIQAEKNLGWQGGINLAFREAEPTPLFCMMNDDVVFLPYNRTFWRSLCAYFQHPEVGAVGPSSNYVMGSQSLFDFRVGAVFETTLLIGFCMVVRSSLFAEVGGLDEGLVGGDDLDLSILIRKSGHKLIVDKTCYLHHIGSQTGPRVEDRFTWNSPDHNEATNNALIRKHGVKAWWETITSRVGPWLSATQTTDSEGDYIREMVAGLDRGLDVGCGANKTVPTAIGVDKDAAGTPGQYGGRKFDDSVADQQGDAYNLPFPDASQDYIVARHLFEHLLDPFAALAEWQRVLKPGGTLVIACPDENVCRSILLDASHVHAYTPKTLQTILEKAGFVVEQTELVRPGISFVTKATQQNAKQTIRSAAASVAAMPRSMEAFYYA